MSASATGTGSGRCLPVSSLYACVHVGDLDRLGALGLRERDEVDVLAGRLGLRPPHADRVAELALALLDRARELLGDAGHRTDRAVGVDDAGHRHGRIDLLAGHRREKPPAIRPEADAPSMYPPDAAENEKSVRSLRASTRRRTPRPRRRAPLRSGAAGELFIDPDLHRAIRVGLGRQL